MGLNIGGGAWKKLTEADGPFTGKVVEAEERGQTYDGSPVMSRNTGKQRTEWVLTFEVPESEEYPEGLVKIALKEGAKIAIGQAVRKVGGKSLDVGGILTIKVTKDAVAGKAGAEYAAKWELPKGGGLPVDDPFASTPATGESAAPPF